MKLLAEVDKPDYVRIFPIMPTNSKHEFSAYGGDDWPPRTRSHQEEVGSLWCASGLNSEWSQLKSVLLHKPGQEWDHIPNPDSVQMLAAPNLEKARSQHTAIAEAYQHAGISVNFVNPDKTPPPNQAFCADLFLMTPEGAILARPASTVRAGEERWVARRLADLGIPIVRTLRGHAVFEGANALWVDPQTVLIGQGLRTNAEGARQVSAALNEMGVEALVVDLPIGTMHLMGILRFFDKNLAMAWPNRLAWSAVELLRARGCEVEFVPDESEATQTSAFNFVTIGPKEILMASGNPNSQAYFESLGVKCHTVVINELVKAAGGIGCLSGILEREIV